jgi:UDP-N-acetylmuramate: L-alanyl-gamma-D-glutamyl-meso-diaminopimelate ligase
MHNLAIALYKKDYLITGSDDEIFEPSAGRLKDCNLLPDQLGWFPDKIHNGLNAVILGMHARSDNPELLRVQEIGIKVYSYPEYIYEQSMNKTRVVIGGSHGKTTITAMVMHVLKQTHIDFDYMVGAQLDGFDTMVKLTNAPLIVIEGDEYLASPIDRRPKFHLYRPDIALISGIAWDHINVFPTFDEYVEQFRIFVHRIADKGVLIYNEEDQAVRGIGEKAPVFKSAYRTADHIIENGITYALWNNQKIPLKIFGNHNLQNLSAARAVCRQLGIEDEKFYQAISGFKGAAKRLEIVSQKGNTVIYKDFAHSPSKLGATTRAVKQQFPERRLIACMELHTFSSLNKKFLQQYHGSMRIADKAIVYFNPHTIEHKRLETLSKEEVKYAFGNGNLVVHTDSKSVVDELKASDWEKTNLLLMSSGNFDGIDYEQLAEEILG